MPLSGFRVGLLFALAGAGFGATFDATGGHEAVWVGGALGTVAGLLAWQAVCVLIACLSMLAAVGRWLVRDPYRKS